MSEILSCSPPPSPTAISISPSSTLPSSSSPKIEVTTVTEETTTVATPVPDSETYLPAVEFHFPDAKLPTEHVVHFCFPHGVEARRIVASQSMSTENGILYDSLKRVEQSDSSYVFLITTADSVLYGVCVRRNELLDVRSSCNIIPVVYHRFFFCRFHQLLHDPLCSLKSTS